MLIFYEFYEDHLIPEGSLDSLGLGGRDCVLLRTFGCLLYISVYGYLLLQILGLLNMLSGYQLPPSQWKAKAEKSIASKLVVITCLLCLKDQPEFGGETLRDFTLVLHFQMKPH